MLDLVNVFEAPQCSALKATTRISGDPGNMEEAQLFEDGLNVISSSLKGDAGLLL